MSLTRKFPFARRSASAGVWVLSDEEDGADIDLKAALEIFARDQGDQDKLELMSEEAEKLSSFADTITRRYKANLEIDDSRLLLASAGASSGSLYAVPVSNGWVCIVATSEAAATRCIKRLGPHGIAPAVSWGASGIAIYGLASGDVRTVEIVLNGRAKPALMGSNSFYLQLPMKPKTLRSLRALVIRYRDGSEKTVEIGL